MCRGEVFAISDCLVYVCVNQLLKDAIFVIVVWCDILIFVRNQLLRAEDFYEQSLTETCFMIYISQFITAECVYQNETHRPDEAYGETLHIGQVLYIY